MSTALPWCRASVVARARVRHASVRAFRITVSLLFLVLAGCGDGTGPDVALTIAMPSGSVLPFQSIEATLSANAVTQATIDGTIGDVALTAARLTDSTVAIIIPPIAAGPQTLTLVTGGTTRKATIQVGTAPAIAEPAVALDAVADRIDASIALQVAGLAIPQDFATVAGIDTAVLRAQLTTLQEQASEFRASFATLTPAEQAQVAAFFAANPALFATTPAGSASPHFALSSSASASGACTDGGACYDAIDRALMAIQVAGFTYVGAVLGAQAASWLGGVISKITVKGVEIVATGVLIGWVLNEIADMTRAPIKALLTGSSQTVIVASPFAVPPPVSLAVGEDLPVLRAGTAGAVPVPVTYRSLTAGDLASDSEVSGIAKAFVLVQAAFAKLASFIPFYDVPVPTFPASPRNSVIQVPPPAQLAVGMISPMGFTATSSASGPNWMVLFASPLQGADHWLDVEVRFTPPGLATQTTIGELLLRPAIYRVATLHPDLAPSSTSVGATVAFTAVARDSSTVIIPASELGNRRPAWTSSDTSVATIDANGIVTGRAKGTATITGLLEDGRMDAPITVNESCNADWVFGTWNATHANWTTPLTPLPAVRYEYNHILDASITVRADSSFSGIMHVYSTDGYGNGMYTPWGSPISAPMENRYEGKLGIACNVSSGVRTVTIETLSLSTSMHGTGPTPGYEGVADSSTSNVRIMQWPAGIESELDVRMTYWPGIGGSITPLVMRK